MTVVQPDSSASDAQGQRIGGWLILIGFGLVISVISNLINCGKLFQILTTAQGFKGSIGLAAVVFEVFIQLYMLGASLFLVALFFSRERGFRKFFIAYVVSLFVLGLIGAGLTASIPGVAPEYVGQALAFPVYIFLLGMIWIPYFLYSKRAKSTFVR